MHETHGMAAEQHELAARAHRTESERNEKGEDPTGNPHDQRSAVEYADHAYELAKKAHAESGKIESL